MIIAGIDPGHTGAVTWLNFDTHTLHTHPMPVRQRQMSEGTKTELDEDKLVELLRRMPPDECWIEDVWSSPQMGVVSSFSFGEGKGVLKGCLAGCGVPRRYVPPSTWKNGMGIHANKELAKKQAWGLFRGSKKLLTSSGKAEAALIALYGILHNHPTLVQSLKVPLNPRR